MRLPFQNPVLQAAASTLALGVFVWGLSVHVPVRGDVGPALDPEESRKMQETATRLSRSEKWQEALAATLRLHAAYPESHIYIGQLAEIYDHLG